MKKLYSYFKFLNFKEYNVKIKILEKKLFSPLNNLIIF
jgi:hypothetical protein